MGYLKQVLLKDIPRARDRQKFGKSTFTEAGEFAEYIRIARDLLGRSTSFSNLNELKQVVLRAIAERVLVYIARDGANLHKLERALNHSRPDADTLTHSKIIDAYVDIMGRGPFPPSVVEVWNCFRRRNPGNKPPTKNVMRDIIRNTLRLPLCNAKPPGRPPGSRNQRIGK
jgi:hypothetical protein